MTLIVLETQFVAVTTVLMVILVWTVVLLQVQSLTLVMLNGNDINNEM